MILARAPNWATIVCRGTFLHSKGAAVPAHSLPCLPFSKSLPELGMMLDRTRLPRGAAYLDPVRISDELNDRLGSFGDLALRERLAEALVTRNAHSAEESA